jgi:hypothetical protein
MIDRPNNHEYKVPRRFGLRTILVVTALVATLLGVSKWTDAPPVVFLYAAFVLVVAGAQIVLERSPRLASILAGVAFLSVVKLATVIFEGGIDAFNVGPFLELFSEGKVIFLIAYGALFGYLSGTLLAGLYLVSDKMQFVINWRYKHGRLPTEAS